MIVGTFTAVSESPPLVAFMPSESSTTFPLVVQNGRFTANVLGEAHEDLCRAFARKDPERFSSGSFVRTDTGMLKVRDAVAWFEADVVQVSHVGDHAMVVGEVRDFGVGLGSSGMPLLFLRGGYGAFSVPSLHFDAKALGWQLRYADQSKDAVAECADELDAECTISCLVNDSVVVLGAFNVSGDSRRPAGPTGVSFPFAAPLAPTFAAWGPPDVTKAWFENARHLVGEVDRPALNAVLASTRRRGLTVSTGRTMARDFEALVDDPEAPKDRMAKLWRDVARESDVWPDPADVAIEDADVVASIQVPVFGPDSTPVLAVAVSRLRSSLRRMGWDDLTSRLLRLSAELTAEVGGVLPLE
jgi:flavin reductase (DIM6/NTAB) family NADH-FMN oxidoreductase RutF/DNA-binding IclR family transcriptional regulator